MASGKRKRTRAAPAVPTPSGGYEPSIVSVVIVLTPGEKIGSVGVEMGLTVDAPQEFCQFISGHEPALRPSMLAFRDAVLKVIGGVGPFPETTVKTVEIVPADECVRGYPVTSRGGNA